jgi:hypothetical protein
MSQIIYDLDFQLWIEQTISQLKKHEFESLDIDNLIEELKNLGKSERNALVGNMIILLAHLLKLKVQNHAPESMKFSWFNSIDEHRTRITQQLVKTPSLKSYLETAIEEAYPLARKLAVKEGKRAAFGVPIPNEDEYPVSCPFLMQQILDENFYSFDSQID